MGDADLYKDRLALALEAAGLDLWENNLHTGEVTRKALQTFLSLGYSDEETAAHMAQAFELVHPDDVDAVKASVHAHLSGHTPQYRCEFRLKAKDGRWVWFANYGKVMDGHVDTPGQRFIGVTFNIDDRKRHEQEIEDINRELAEKNALLESYNRQLMLLATTDSLTGLVNRRRLMELGTNECKRARRFQHALSLLIIDIDLFKTINDAWGHQVGDHVICAVSDICAKRVRQGVDTAARIGGEEFVVLLPETGHAQACALAETLRQAVAAQSVPANAQGDAVNFTISIGVATRTGHSPQTFEQLLHQADKALYKAKQAGRNQVQTDWN